MVLRGKDDKNNEISSMPLSREPTGESTTPPTKVKFFSNHSEISNDDGAKFSLERRWPQDPSHNPHILDGPLSYTDRNHKAKGKIVKGP